MITIRLATPADWPAIIAIYNQAVPSRQATAELEPVTVESRRIWFEKHQDRYPIYVAEKEPGQILGWGSLSEFYSGRGGYFETAEVSVYIDLHSQSQGIGRALLEHLIRSAPTLGFRRLVALIFAHNPASLKMCARLGFTQWGYLPGVANMDGVIRDLEILGLVLTTDHLEG